MEMVLMLELLRMLMERLTLRQGGVGGDSGFDFPAAEATEQQDLPSPGEEEDFRLHRRF